MVKKSLFISIVLLLVVSVCGAQVLDFHQFASKYKHKKDVVHLSLPGFIVELGANFVNEKDLNGVNIRPFLKGLHHLNLLVFDDAAVSPSSEDVKALIEGAHQDKFEDLIIVKDGHERVNILIRESDNIVRNLLLIVTDKGKNNSSNVFISMKCHFAMSDINKLVESAMEKKGPNFTRIQ